MSALTTPERPQIDASRPSEKNHALAEGWRELRRGAGTENVFVRRREIVAQGERLPNPRYSGHHFSRLMRGASMHRHPEGLAYYMRES